MYKKFFIIFGLIFFQNFFQNKSFGFSIKNADIDIESKVLEIAIDQNKARFIGNVVAKQNDFRVNSDELILFFRKNTIEKVVFLNNVKIRAGNQVAYGNRGEYSKNNPIFKLTGKIHLVQKNNEIYGDVLTYNINTKKASVSTIKNDKSISKKKRVQIRLHS